MSITLDTSAELEPDMFRLDVVPAVAEGKPELPGPSRRYDTVEIGGFGRHAVVALLCVLFAASVGDFVNAKTVFDLVFTHSSAYNAWALAISLTALAIIATHTAGYLSREAHGRRGHKTMSLALVGAWLAAGTLLAVLRVAVDSGSSPVAGSSLNPFAGLQLNGGDVPHPAVLAAVLGAVWVATGLVSFALGYLAHAPVGAALDRLERISEKRSRELGTAIAMQRQAAHTLEAQRIHKARLSEAWRRANAGADARRDELQAWARLELVRLLGDPAATNDILPRPNIEKES
jgi:hypothetical protein